ncbi:MAG: hypothetical protein ACK5LT_03165 [Lachnospirales bacterium]
MKKYVNPVVCIIPMGGSSTIKAVTEKMHQYIKTLYYASGEHVSVFINTQEVSNIDDLNKKTFDISIVITDEKNFSVNTIDKTSLHQKAILIVDKNYGSEKYKMYDLLEFPIYEFTSKNMQEEFSDKLKRQINFFVEGASSIFFMHNKKILNIGHKDTNFGIGDKVEIGREYFGLKYETMDVEIIKERIENGIYDKDEYDRALKWVLDKCKVKIDGKTINVNVLEDWGYSVKMTLVARDIIEGNNKLKELGYPEASIGKDAIITTLRGDDRWLDYYTSGNFVETVLNSSFYWDGIKEPSIIYAETNSLTALSMLMSHLATGKPQNLVTLKEFFTPRHAKRVSGFDLPVEAKEGVIHFTSKDVLAMDFSGNSFDESGNNTVKAFWELTENDINRNMEAIDFIYSDKGYYLHGGFFTKYDTVPNLPLTISCIAYTKNLGPVMHIMEGNTVYIKDEMRDLLKKHREGFQSSLWFVPKSTQKLKTVKDFASKWESHNAAVSYGHIGDQLITMASMLRIPVTMHNVEDDRIFRPVNWQKGRENDLLSSTKFGPLYS